MAHSKEETKLYGRKILTFFSDLPMTSLWVITGLGLKSEILTLHIQNLSLSTANDLSSWIVVVVIYMTIWWLIMRHLSKSLFSKTDFWSADQPQCDCKYCFYIQKYPTTKSDAENNLKNWFGKVRKYANRTIFLLAHTFWPTVTH